jgi:hypothetical protein
MFVTRARSCDLPLSKSALPTLGSASGITLHRALAVALRTWRFLSGRRGTATRQIEGLNLLSLPFAAGPPQLFAPGRALLSGAHVRCAIHAER